MFFEGNHDVVKALHAKRDLLQSGADHMHVRPLLIICGGVMKGIFGGAAVVTLHKMGYGSAFDVVVGLSTGAPTAAYFLAGQQVVGTRIYSEECCSKQFINPWRITRMCDVSYLMSVFRDSPEKRLERHTVLNHRSQLHIGVTEYSSARQQFFVPVDTDSLFTLMEASMTMPGVCPKPVLYKGEQWVDGSYSDPLPIEYLIAIHRPTHVLIVANRECVQMGTTPLWEQALYETVFRSRLSPSLRRTARARGALMSERFSWVRTQSRTPILVGWGDDSIQSFTRNPTLLRAAAERSVESWSKLLSGQQ